MLRRLKKMMVRDNVCATFSCIKYFIDEWFNINNIWIMKVFITIKKANIISNVINVTHMNDFLNKNAGINMFGRINNLFRFRKCYELQPRI